MRADSQEMCVVLVTCPSAEAARDIARTLVEEQLIACANLYPIDSIFRWQGRISEEREYQLVLKSAAALFPLVQRRVAELHPYEVPEIVHLPVSGVNPAYQKWVFESVKQDAP